MRGKLDLYKKCRPTAEPSLPAATGPQPRNFRPDQTSIAAEGPAYGPESDAAARRSSIASTERFSRSHRPGGSTFRPRIAPCHADICSSPAAASGLWPDLAANARSRRLLPALPAVGSRPWPTSALGRPAPPVQPTAAAEQDDHSSRRRSAEDRRRPRVATREHSQSTVAQTGDPREKRAAALGVSSGRTIIGRAGHVAGGWSAWHLSLATRPAGNGR